MWSYILKPQWIYTILFHDVTLHIWVLIYPYSFYSKDLCPNAWFHGVLSATLLLLTFILPILLFQYTITKTTNTIHPPHISCLYHHRLQRWLYSKPWSEKTWGCNCISIPKHQYLFTSTYGATYQWIYFFIKAAVLKFKFSIMLYPIDFILPIYI
jgi:hypothetical protein